MAARARPCAARTRLFELIATPNGALRAPPPRPSQLRCFLFEPEKYIKSIGPPTSRAFFFPLDHRGYEILGPLPPRPAHRSFAYPFDNILGSKCTGATISNNFFRLFLFCIAFSRGQAFWIHLVSTFLFYPFLLFFIFSSCYSLRILLYISLLILLFLALLFLLLLYSSFSYYSTLIFKLLVFSYYFSLLFNFYLFISSYSSRSIFFLFLFFSSYI